MLKFTKGAVKWSRRGIDDYYWLYYTPNWLGPRLRYFGYGQEWYDGPFSSFGFWWFNVCWRLPWTRHRGTRSLMFRAPQGLGQAQRTAALEGLAAARLFILGFEDDEAQEGITDLLAKIEAGISALREPVTPDAPK